MKETNSRQTIPRQTLTEASKSEVPNDPRRFCLTFAVQDKLFYYLGGISYFWGREKQIAVHIIRANKNE